MFDMILIFLHVIYYNYDDGDGHDHSEDGMMCGMSSSFQCTFISTFKSRHY